jgi:hypothetical protein
MRFADLGLAAATSIHIRTSRRRPAMTENHGRISAGHFARLVTANGLAVVASVLALALLVSCQQNEAEIISAPVVDIWDVYYLQGAKIGYGHTTVSTINRKGRDLVQVDSLNHLSITRFGETSEQEVTMQTLETAGGDVLEFSTTINFGPTPTIISGRVADKEMVITTETQGRKSSSRMPWSSDVRGFRGVEQSLSEKPLMPGEKRSLKMLMPVVNQIAAVELAAATMLEPTRVLGVETNLLRIECVSRLPANQIMETTLWTDAAGEVIKTSMTALQQESFRTTQQTALTPAVKAGQLDLGVDLFVKVDPPLAKPLKTREVTYRVELTDGDPTKVFASGPTQSVKSLGPHVAEVTVRSIRPGDTAMSNVTADKPTPEYATANSVLQIDDPQIRKMATEAKGNAKTPAELAVALERYVHGAVSEKNFSHGFATAAEVAESRAGDCTEHAVLLAALARVVGLPSRVAIGLVYVDRAGAFGYHMWTEVFLDGRWIPLDAIQGGGGTSAAYLKLNDSSLEGASAYSSFLSVAQVLGQLKVSVVSAK